MNMTILSILDLVPVGEGQSTAEALSATTRLARLADRLGYYRFWVAEHHCTPSVASTNPPVIIAHLAAATERIRVGSGGVMLPNHAPLVVAEQFALLEALHAGRIDLGIGRAPGTDSRTVAALREGRVEASVEEFPQHLLTVMALLGDERVDPDLTRGLRATPQAGSTPEVLLLGSSGFSSKLAGRLGLPFAFAHHFASEHTERAVEDYREHFEPSATLAEPYLIIGVPVLAADDEESAETLALPGLLSTLGIRTNRMGPIPSVATALEHPDLPWAQQLRGSRIIGNPQQVVAGLKEVAAATGADELMLTTITHGYPERARSYELIAEQWGLSPTPAG